MSTRGQVAQECPTATKFARMNPWLKCSALVGLKVIQGSARVSQGQPGVKLLRNVLWLPNLVGTLPKCSAMLGSKVRWGQPEVILLINAVWPTYTALE